MIKVFVFLLAATSALAQQGARRDRAFEDTGAGRFRQFGASDEKLETTTPRVEIKRFVNQQNPDGSYTYGFEAEDGTFRLETRNADGAVNGKYGFYDANNELKVVEYNAGSGVGFSPQGNLIDEAGAGVPPASSSPSRSQESSSSRGGGEGSRAPPPQAPPRQAPPRQAPPPRSDDRQQQFATQGGSRRVFPVGDPNVFRVETPIIPRRPPSTTSLEESGFTEDGQYIPSIALEGFSEDADKDGFVDELPQDGRLPPRNDRRRPSGGAPPRSAAPAISFPRESTAPQQAAAAAPGFGFSFGQGIDGIQRQEFPFQEVAQRRPPPSSQRRPQVQAAPAPQFAFTPQEPPRSAPAQSSQFAAPAQSSQFAAPRVPASTSFQGGPPPNARPIFTASGQPFPGGAAGAFNPTQGNRFSGQRSSGGAPRFQGSDTPIFRSSSPEAISPSFRGVPGVNPLLLRRAGG